MNPVVNTAKSGMELQGKRLASAAGNLVTARTAAAVGAGPDGDPTALTAQRVEAVSVAMGGVRGAVQPLVSMAPALRAGGLDNDDEPGDRLAAVASEEAETSTLLQARRAYSANVRSFRAGADLLGEEFDVEA